MSREGGNILAKADRIRKVADSHQSQLTLKQHKKRWLTQAEKYVPPWVALRLLTSL